MCDAVGQSFVVGVAHSSFTKLAMVYMFQSSAARLGACFLPPPPRSRSIQRYPISADTTFGCCKVLCRNKSVPNQLKATRRHRRGQRYIRVGTKDL